MPKKNNRIINLDTAAGEGNPSSLHAQGVQAAHQLGEARAVVARILDAHADEIIFTSGGTEANNLAIFGLIKNKTEHIVTTKIEHASILEPCRELERRGHRVTYLPVNQDGLVSPSDLAKALRPETVLVSIGYANNEIGVIQPIHELAKVVRHFKAKKLQANEATSYPFFHTDACQAPRFLDLNVDQLGVDLMTLNSGKVYGPEGVGCLYVRRGINLQPILYGGGQERGFRSGTENVAGIVGFAGALAQCVKSRKKESARLIKLRDYFIEQLLAPSEVEGPNVTLNGSREARLPNNVNVSFVGADSEFVVLNLDVAGVLVSSGSACSAPAKDASYVIKAIGGPASQLGGLAENAVRFTLGRDTTKTNLNYVLKILPAILLRSRIG